MKITGTMNEFSYYNPNIQILKSHIVTFTDQIIYLYNIGGYLLTTITIDSSYEIINICFINNNFIIGFTTFDLFKIKIKDSSLDIIQKITDLWHEIVDVLYLEKNQLLIIAYHNYIAIKDTNFINEQPIQIIKKEYFFY